MRSSHKSKKKRKEKKRKYRSSSSSSSSNEEWVEATPTKLLNEKTGDNETSSDRHTGQRDEWMSEPMVFSGLTRDQLRKKKEPKEDENKYMLDRLGQTDRELNPYWKDGGSGLPEEVKDLNVPGAAVGDHGVEWLRKALHRAKEQAAEEGRRLEDIVAERWGSLEKLESMIKEAESRSKHNDTRHSHDKSYYKYKEKDGSNYKFDRNKDEEMSIKSSKDREYGYSRDRDTFKKQFQKPSEDSDRRNQRRDDKHRKNYADSERFDRDKFRDRGPGKHFMKPSDDDNEDYISNKRKEIDEKTYSDDSKQYRSKDIKTGKQFLKPDIDDEKISPHKNDMPGRSHCFSAASGSGKGWRKNPQSHTISQVSSESRTNENDAEKLRDQTSNCAQRSAETDTSSQPVFLTADERNELAAKLIKAEIMGNVDLVKKLKSRLEEARTVAAEAENTVILTRTDSKGFTQPLSLPSKPEYGRGKKEKTQTHEGGKRIRYFADDDKYSLQEMFEREKRSTVEDQNEMFARLASKNVGRDESAHDMDDVFEDMVRVKESAGKAAARERDKAIEQHRRSSKAIDNCQWCIDGKRLLKHLVITVGSKVFLCLPPYESLTEGHCLLIPTQHILCATQLDEDVWEELQVFRKALVQMFLSMDMDVVFFECAMNFSHMPHMVWQCVPLPKESGDVAPIYFKKAILECETEWASNKKLVDLAGKNVRRAIPRGLPYFAVDFGLQSGFAHVIEDEKVFPKNFAQEIIGGMLDVDHRVWRKPKFQKFEEQRQKVVEFTKWWKPFNCIKQDLSTSCK